MCLYDILYLIKMYTLPASLGNYQSVSHGINKRKNKI